MLTCQNLRCIRGGKELFSHLGFTLGPGSALTLTGPNGSGKTSLLRLLGGLMQPSEGMVLWNDKPVGGNPEFLETLVYIGHQNALKPELTVYDNIQYWAALRGTEMLVPSAMQFFGLLNISEMQVGSLSAGWQRRVALARLLAMPGLVWLLDEPASNLDAEGCGMLEGLIDTRARQGGIIILSSHAPMPGSMTNFNLGDFSGHHDGAAHAA